MLIETVMKKMTQKFWSVAALKVIICKKYIECIVIFRFSAFKQGTVLFFVSYLSPEIWAKTFKFSFSNFVDFVKKILSKLCMQFWIIFQNFSIKNMIFHLLPLHKQFFVLVQLGITQKESTF